MQPRGGQPEQGVPRFDGFAIQNSFAFHRTDDESREIVLAGGIKTRHLRGLPANQGTTRFAASTAHTFDKLFDHVGFEFAHGQVIEEKKRLGALHENVVNAVIDEIAADGGVHAHGHGDFQLCAHAIGARNQHRLLPFFVVERKERAKATDAAEDARSKRAAGMMPDALLGFVSDGNIDTGIGVFHGGSNL